MTETSSSDDQSLAAFRAAVQEAFPPASPDAWGQQIQQDFRDEHPQERLRWQLLEGFDMEAFWRREDLEQLFASGHPASSLSKPDRLPWLLNTPIPIDDAAAANRRLREAVEGGADALTLTGPAEHFLPAESWQCLFEGIDLSDLPVQFESGPLARLILARLLDWTGKQGINAAALRGSVAFDPLKPLLQRGAAPLGALFDEAALLLQDLRIENLSLHGLCVDTRPYHEAGATGVEELAYALAATSEVLHQLQERGLSPRRFAHLVRWQVAVDTSFLLEIAKLRALRLLVPRVLAAYDPARSGSTMYIHATTSPRSLTLYDPHTNLLRTTTQAASALVGGCEELTILPYDTPLNRHSDNARRLARNIGLILRHEVHLNHVADAAAGSYYVEHLTERLAQEAWNLFQEVEAQGGLIAALEVGSVQDRLAVLRAQRTQALNWRKQVLIGTNQYPNPSESRLADSGASRAEPAPLRVSLEGSPADLREAVRKGKPVASLTREPSSRESIITPLPAWRAAASFEQMRLHTERFAEEHDRRPRFVLLPFGDPVMASARASFAYNLLGCAGFEMVEPAPFTDFNAGLEAAREVGPDAVVLCSSDDGYREHGRYLAERLKASAPAPLVLLAGPPDALDEAERATIDQFIHRKVDALDTLRAIQEVLGLPTT